MQQQHVCGYGGGSKLQRQLLWVQNFRWTCLLFGLDFWLYQNFVHKPDMAWVYCMDKRGWIHQKISRSHFQLFQLRSQGCWSDGAPWSTLVVTWTAVLQEWALVGEHTLHLQRAPAQKWQLQLSKRPKQQTRTTPREKFSPNRCFGRLDFLALMWLHSSPKMLVQCAISMSPTWVAQGHHRASPNGLSGQA